MKTAIRHKNIINKVNAHGSVSVVALATDLAVSRETIRRDLSYLAKNDHLRKVHGGAVPLPTSYEMALDKRVLDKRSEKVIACQKALTLIKENDTLFIDSGTTTMLLAQLLSDFHSLTVITNSSQIAEITSKNNKTFLLGGWFSQEKAGNFGQFVIEQAQHFQTDHAFLSIGAVHHQYGFSNFSEDEATLARVMHKQAKQTTIIVDHTKLSKRALVKVCELKEVDYLCLDIDLPTDYIEAFEQANVQVL